MKQQDIGVGSLKAGLNRATSRRRGDRIHTAPDFRGSPSVLRMKAVRREVGEAESGVGGTAAGVSGAEG